MLLSLNNWLQTYRLFIEMEISDLKEYVQTLENFLSAEMKRLDGESEVRASEMPKDQRMDFYDSVSDDHYRLAETFPNILRHSLFAHSYSLLEYILLEIAEHFQKSQKLDLSPSDLRDEGIRRAQSYLKKVVRVSFPDSGTIWQEISTLGYIRNLVVHNQGYLTEDNPRKDQIHALIAKWSSDLSLKKNKFIFSATFIKRVVLTFETFLNDLFKNIKEPS